MERQQTVPSPAPDTQSGPALSLEGVGFTYPQARRHADPVEAVADVSLVVEREQIVALVGPSGCGKSTLLELICGLREPTAGSVSGDPAVLMPQRDLLLPWFDALDNAGLALRLRPGGSRAAARAGAQATFADFGLTGFERSRPHELSGGMRQRVAFLRTLLSGKPLLCLDEPFGALDALTRAEMRDWLGAALVRTPRTTLLVTHDVEEACVLADRVIVLSPRPARVLASIDVALPRPRRATDPQLLALRERALEALGA